jgi:predicted anti-sigma-YlaC factor YlaD
MMRHLNDDELLVRLYGLGENQTHVGETHLGECPECAGRLAAMESRRAESAAEFSEDRVSSDFLAGQRRAVYARLEQPASAGVRWAPAVAAATLLAVGVLMYHPARPAHRAPAPAARTEQSQEQVFSDVFADVFSMEQAAEPRAAAPIRSLFEDQVTEQQ